MAELSTIARPYAKAAFEYAVSAEDLQTWSDMLVFCAAVVNDESIKDLLLSPHLTKERQSEVILSVCQDKLNEQGRHFVSLLAQNRRLLALPYISELFEEMKASYEKTIDVKVVSATELTQQQTDNLKNKLTQKLGRQVQVNTQVDTSLIGGLIVEAEDMVIDSSMRGQLAKLSEALSV